MSDRGDGPGAAELHLAVGLGLLRPEEQAFTAMLDGWAAQQRARRLAAGTVSSRQRAVRAFAALSGLFPWSWTAQLADEWFTDLRAVRGLRASRLRSCQEAVRLFCDCVTDPGTFETVARVAVVSRSWLYAQPDIRAEIERFRAVCDRASA